MSPSLPSSKPVELWYSRCGAATASAIAIRKHWLQDEFDRPGTVLRSLRDADDQAVRDAHYHHGLSGFFREGGNIPPIWARSGGRDTGSGGSAGSAGSGNGGESGRDGDPESSDEQRYAILLGRAPQAAPGRRSSRTPNE